MCTQRRANGSTGSRAYRSTPKFPFCPFVPSSPMPCLLLRFAYLCKIVCLCPPTAHPRPAPCYGLILAVKETPYEPRFDQFCYFLLFSFQTQIFCLSCLFFYLFSPSSKNAFRYTDAVAFFFFVMVTLKSGLSYFLCSRSSLLLEVSRSCSLVLLLLEFIPRACCSTGHIPPFCHYRPFSP